jgi:superfamily II DNA or RNA helicase
VPKRRRQKNLSDDGSTIQLQLPLLSDALKECQDLRSELDSLGRGYSEIRQENARLREENAILRSRLSGEPDVSPKNKTVQEPLLTVKYNPDGQYNEIHLLRSLFHGRQDVYAERGKTRDVRGKWPYWPARNHDWSIPHKSTKGAKSKCSSVCPLLPLDDRVIQDHLAGKRTIGIYALLPDETCRFLAHDFDKGNWQDDVLAFLATCDALRVPAHLERSQSGNGAHVWIFFDSPVTALQARKFGSYLITKTNERFYLDLESHDRMFPNQDTMPEGGFGNLIALPLQLEASELGNSVFVDRQFQPYEDQWEYLRSIERMRSVDVCSIVDTLPQESLISLPEPSDDETSNEPWKQKPSGPSRDPILRGAVPVSTTVVLSNMIYLDKTGFSSSVINRIMSIAAFQNPKFYKHQAIRLSTYNIPRIISCAENLSKHVALPRGCLNELLSLLETNNIAVERRDERFIGMPIAVNFVGNLRPEQTAASEAILDKDIGILAGTTGFGKTVVSAYVMAQRGVNTLIVVETKALLHQWKEKLQQFLDVPPGNIGQIGGGKKKPSGIIDVATIQSLVRKGVVVDVVAEYGQLIIDECHHISSVSFESVIKQAKARYVLGLTATPVRKDGDHPIFMMQCGPIVFKDTRKLQERHPGVVHVVIPRETGFETALPDVKENYHELCTALAADEARNNLIVDDILKVLAEKRTPLAITERIDHLEALAAKLQVFGKTVLLLRGGMSEKETKEFRSRLRNIPDGEERIVLAIGKCAGEGFDDPRLDTLFLMLPISWHGTVEQYVGRMHRDHEGKTEVQIYDYLDSRSRMLKGMYKKRAAKYPKIGYEIRS